LEPGTSGKTSIRAGWGLFYNPIEQLVLEQFSAEPPFGGSTFPFNTMSTLLFRTERGLYLSQSFRPALFVRCQRYLNPTRGQPVDWGMFRPILLFGSFSR